jgi:hypothetical protein
MTLLMDLVKDGGAIALDKLSYLAREGDPVLKDPAMAAMLCWKESGCQEIVATALAKPTPKYLSSALKTLSIAAVGEPINPTILLIHDPTLEAAINDSIAAGQLRKSAREHLMDLLQSLDADGILIPLGTAFTQMGMIGTHGVSELIRAISFRWLRVGPSVVTTYEALIRSQADNEPAMQDFFCKHPQILDPMAQQVWSQPDFHGIHEPDFVIRRTDNSYLIVEIETPRKQLITQGGQLSADATHAGDYPHFVPTGIDVS